MASIAKYKTGYRAMIYVGGVRKSKTFRTKREAEAWASSSETEIRIDKKTAPKNKYTLGDVLARYRDEVAPTHRGSRRELISINAMLNNSMFPRDVLLADLTPNDLGQYRDHRLATIKPSSFNREFTIVRAALGIARREWQWLEQNPASDVRRPPTPPHRETVIRWSQIKRMLRALDYDRKPPHTEKQFLANLFLFALRTGMRQGEVCNMKEADIKEHYVELKKTKTVARQVPIARRTRRILERVKGLRSPSVFGMKEKDVESQFRKYRKAAGLSGFTFHDTRHTAATWIAQKLHVLDLCKMFGWKSPARAMIYYNPKASDIAKKL